MSCTVSNVLELNVRLRPLVIVPTIPAVAPKIPFNAPGPVPSIKPSNVGVLFIANVDPVNVKFAFNKT